MATARLRDSDLRNAMKDSLDAYASGKEAFFDFLADDVRVYTLESSEPMLGRKAFQKYFGPTFARIKRTVELVAEDVQSAGELAAIGARTIQVTSEGVSVAVRQTIVWDKSSGQWRMSHIHNAFAGQPIAVGKMPKTARGIRVLNERIATVAATVGVAQ